MDETRITAELPHLAIEIIRHEVAAGDPERLTIHLQASPSLAAWRDPVAGPMAAALAWWTAPLRAWSMLAAAGRPRFVETSRLPRQENSPT